MFWGFNFEHNLRYPKITRDIMVYAGFRDAWRDIPDHLRHIRPPTRTIKKTWIADLIRRRWALMEQAINKFLQRLEKQEKKGFKDLAALLSHLPKTARGSARPGAPCLWQRLCRLVFSQHWTKIGPICSPRWSCTCTDTLRTTGYYPWISWVILVYLVISLACQLDNCCPVAARE